MSGISLNTIWSSVLEKITAEFNEFQLEKIKMAMFCELGKYDFSAKEGCTDLVAYNEENNGYMMFFIAKKVEGLSEKSLKYYKSTIDKFLETTSKSLNALNADDIRWYLAKRQMQDGVTAITADSERRILHSFFGWLADETYIDRNIVKSIKAIKAKKSKKKAFTEIELQKIRDECLKIRPTETCMKSKVDEEQKRNIALIEFLLSTGCRVGEISILKRDDIDLENRTALVLGKGNKERTVFLTPTAKMRLIEYWEIAGEKEYAFSPLTNEKLHGKNIRVSGLEIIVREIGKRAGVKNCHPHKFRRTCATIAYKKGMSAVDIQKMLGHASLETTRIYLDLDDTDLKYQHDKYF